MTSSQSMGSSQISAARLRPRDAATLIVVDTSGTEPSMLMGRRGMNHVFMPGKYVFPGGRVEAADRTVQTADEPRPAEIMRLQLQMRGVPSAARARALPLAAIRETFEEAGIVIGEGREPVLGRSRGWQDFLRKGYLPKPGALTFFARAITPPGRPRRFDTRFFYVDASAIALRVPPPDDELESLDWFTLEQIRVLDLPAITRVIIEDLTDLLRCDVNGRTERPVPFYSHRNGSFRRELLG